MRTDIYRLVKELAESLGDKASDRRNKHDRTVCFEMDLGDGFDVYYNRTDETVRASPLRSPEIGADCVYVEKNGAGIGVFTPNPKWNVFMNLFGIDYKVLERLIRNNIV